MNCKNNCAFRVDCLAARELEVAVCLTCGKAFKIVGPAELRDLVRGSRMTPRSIEAALSHHPDSHPDSLYAQAAHAYCPKAVYFCTGTCSSCWDPARTW